METNDPNPPSEYGSFIDSRDGRVYKTVKIGTQTWLAENLAYNTKGSKAYNNDLANESKYGRLYNWETAQKAVPPGWHLPNNNEWQTLIDYADDFTPPEDYDYKRDSKTAGKRLKAVSGWNNDGNGTDELGFSALPGGHGNSNGGFYAVGDYGFWWSASEYSSDYAYSRGMYYNYEYAYWSNYGKDLLLSVRCVRDAGEAV